MTIGLIIYIGRIVLHNKYRNAPDDAEDQMLTSFRAHHVNSSDGIGTDKERCQCPVCVLFVSDRRIFLQDKFS